MKYAILPVLLALCACKDPAADKGKQGVQLAAEGVLTPEEKGKVVARVGDRVITLEDFEKRLNQQSPFARARYNSLERKKEFLDTLVRFELLALEAEAKGFGEHPDVVLARKQAMVKRLTAEEIRNLVKLSDITDADIEAWYTEHPEEYDKPAQVRASHILFADQAAASKVLADVQAEIAKDKTKARGVFEDFARKHSTDAATKDRGGDLQFFGEPGKSQVQRGPLAPPLVPGVQTAAFALAAVGDVHPAPIQSSQGWHLVQKTGFRRPYKRNLEDVKNSIRNKLFRVRKGKAMEAYVKALRDKSAVKIDDAVLEEAKIEKGGPAPPSLDPPRLGGPGGMLPLPKRRPR